jgi:hypothetical protein
VTDHDGPVLLRRNRDEYSGAGPAGAATGLACSACAEGCGEE